MRSGVVIAIALVIGLIVITGIVAAVGNDDHTGEAVSASSWADDVCGSVGAWEGQLEGIRDELNQSNYAARRSDGGSGDSVERTVTVRVAIDRAIRATSDVLREGIKRAGFPEGNAGRAASLLFRGWALKTELDLRVAKQVLREDTDSTSKAYGALNGAGAALQQAAVNGRATYNKAAALDPAIGDALHGSDNCKQLTEEQP
jgi:hypothetical protein